MIDFINSMPQPSRQLYSYHFSSWNTYYGLLNGERPSYGESYARPGYSGSRVVNVWDQLEHYVKLSDPTAVVDRPSWAPPSSIRKTQTSSFDVVSAFGWLDDFAQNSANPGVTSVVNEIRYFWRSIDIVGNGVVPVTSLADWFFFLFCPRSLTLCLLSSFSDLLHLPSVERSRSWNGW
jgi:hypothetical protein